MNTKARLPPPQVGNFLHFFSTFLAGFAVGFSSIWSLTLIILAIVPAIAVVGAVYTTILTGVTSKSQEAYSHAGGIAEQVNHQPPPTHPTRASQSHTNFKQTRPLLK